MWASANVEVQISTNADAGLGHGLVNVVVNFLVFDRTPEPLDEDVVSPYALAVHRYGDLRLGEVHRADCVRKTYRFD